MSQPLLTEIYDENDHGLVAWPTTDLRRAISSLRGLDDNALTRACTAIRAGREGREGPVEWHPLPDPADAIAAALKGPYEALTANHHSAVIEADNGRALAIRDRDGLILSLGAPPDGRPAPLFAPIAVRTPRGLTWSTVPHLARAAAGEVDTRIARSLREAATAALAHYMAHRHFPALPSAEGAANLSSLVESLPGCPQSGPWASLARVDGRPMAVYQWCPVWGGLAYGMISPDDLTAESVADITGVSVEQAARALIQARDDEP